MFGRTAPFLIAAAIVPLAFAARPVLAGDTDFIREFAKNNVPVLIVASGPQAMPVAQALEQSVRRNQYYKRGDGGVRTLSLADAEQADFRGATVVFVMTRSDLAHKAAGAGGPEYGLSPRLAGLLPFGTSELETFHSLVQAGQDTATPGAPVYRVALLAPDDVRLRRIYDTFTARRAPGFRELPFTEQHLTNRVNVFSSPEIQPLLTSGWGNLPIPGIWNDVIWHSLADRNHIPPDQLVEGSQVYFLDRSQPGAAPRAVAGLLAGSRMRPATVLALRGGAAMSYPAPEASDETPLEMRPPPPDSMSLAAPSLNGEIYVISAPSRLLLETRILRYPNTIALRKMPVSFEAADLRGLTAAPFVVPSDNVIVNDEAAGAISEPVARYLRDRARVPVSDNSPAVEVMERDGELLSLQTGMGTMAAKQMRAKLHSRYVWLYRLTELAGTTRYESKVDPLTPPPPAFTDTEPVAPRDKYRKESDDDFEKRKQKYSDDHDRWDRKRRDYQDHVDNDPCHWQLQVIKIQIARARGMMQLWDLSAETGPQPVWQKECFGRSVDSSEDSSVKATVRGHVAKPDPPRLPAAIEACEERFLVTAASTAGQIGVDRLVASALLPESGAPPSLTSAGPVPTSSGGDSSAPSAPTPAPADKAAVSALSLGKVADIDGQTITLTVGAADGINVGDRLLIVLKVRDIRDPDTGELRDSRVLDSITVRVVKSEITADCVPATPRDAARMSQIHAGLWVRRAAAAQGAPTPATGL